MWLFGVKYSCITTGDPTGAFEGKENDFNARSAVGRFSPRGPVYDRITAIVALGRAYPLTAGAIVLFYRSVAAGKLRLTRSRSIATFIVSSTRARFASERCLARSCYPAPSDDRCSTRMAPVRPISSTIWRNSAENAVGLV